MQLDPGLFETMQYHVIFIYAKRICVCQISNKLLENLIHLLKIFTLWEVSALDIHLSSRLIVNMSPMNVKWNGFPKTPFSQMYNFLSLFCLKNFYWNMATFPNKCVFNSSRLHKPIAIIQIKSLIFHVFCIYVEYESFGIWTQVCNVGNTPSWIFNMLWICVCGNFLGGYFLPNFCWWGRAMLLWWWMAQRMKGNHFFSLAEYFSEY